MSKQIEPLFSTFNADDQCVKVTFIELPTEKKADLDTPFFSELFENGAKKIADYIGENIIEELDTYDLECSPPVVEKYDLLPYSSEIDTKRHVDFLSEDVDEQIKEYQRGLKQK